jgi:probable rRNA maturation factor
MVELENKQSKVPFDGDLEELITRAISSTLEYENFNKGWEVSVTITDNEDIREINNQYRNIDKATDVLSFPMLEFEEGYEEDGDIEVGIEDINPESGGVVLGDIVVSLEKALEQSEEYGHSLERELAFLVVHSTLHLLGYDHIEEADKVIMRKKEEEILKAMKLERN